MHSEVTSLSVYIVSQNPKPLNPQAAALLSSSGGNLLKQLTSLYRCKYGRDDISANS